MNWLSNLAVTLKTRHSERELSHALHIIDKHRDALEDALDSVGLHVHRNPRKRKVEGRE